jgi:Carboxypeptidase regulatory-like domain
MNVLVAIGLLAQTGVQLASGLPPRDQPAPKTGAAIIRGRIVAADTAKPLRRAQITVSAPGLPPPGRSANTNVDGRYEIKDLPAGSYTVTVTRSGYLQLRYGQHRPLEQARPLEVLDRQVVEHVNFSLPRMAVIAGRITDEVADPVAGVTVVAMRSMYFEGRRQLVPMAGGITRTDDAGQYRIPALVPGTYFVLARMGETWTVNTGGQKTVMGFVPTYFPGTASPAEAKRVAVGIGQEVRGIDLSLIPGRTARISGRALDSQGRPLAGRSVGLMVEFRSSQFGGAFQGVGGTTVGTDGTFTLRDVPPGEYQLSAMTAAPAAGMEERASQTAVVAGVDVDDVVLVTQAPWSIAGQVVNEQGTPPAVPRDRVNINARTIGGRANPLMGRGDVKEDWTFAVKNILGPARLLVAAPDGWAVKTVLQDGRDVADAVLEAKHGETLAGVQVVLTDRVTTVSGQVADDKGAPLADGTVLVFASDAEKWAEDSRYIRAARPDEQGQFVVRGLPPGDYLAVAIEYVQEGQWNDPEYLESVRRYAQKVTLREGGSQAIALKLATP